MDQAWLVTYSCCAQQHRYIAYRRSPRRPELAGSRAGGPQAGRRQFSLANGASRLSGRLASMQLKGSSAPAAHSTGKEWATDGSAARHLADSPSGSSSSLCVFTLRQNVL